MSKSIITEKILLGIFIFLIITLVLPFYLIYLILVSVIDLIHNFLLGCADYFKVVKDCLEGHY